MKITIAQYQKSKEAIKKLMKHQEIVHDWEMAVKGYKPAEGQKVVEVQVKDGGCTRYVTENDEETSQAASKKSA